MNFVDVEWNAPTQPNGQIEFYNVISSSLSDPSYLITKFIGTLRHFDASIPKGMMHTILKV